MMPNSDRCVSVGGGGGVGGGRFSAPQTKGKINCDLPILPIRMARYTIYFILAGSCGHTFKQHLR